MWYILDFNNRQAGIKMVYWKKECSLIKRDALTELPLTHKIPIRHPPDSGDIHFPLIVFNNLLPLETAASHSSSLAAVTLKETPNQNICLSFSLRSDRWMRADTGGRYICTNQGLISVSPPGECFISTGHWWIRHLALIWRSGSPLPKCQVTSQRQQLSRGHYRRHSHLPLPWMLINVAVMILIFSFVKWAVFTSLYSIEWNFSCSFYVLCECHVSKLVLCCLNS